MVAEKVFAVIAESTRRDILQALARESKAVGQLVEELGVAQPTVSKHLRVLREAGVVTMRAQGQKRYYCINAEPLALISSWLESLGAGVAAVEAPVVAQAAVPATPAAVAAPAAGVAAEAAVLKLEAADLSGAAELVEAVQAPAPEFNVAKLLTVDVGPASSPASELPVEEFLEKVPAAAAIVPSATRGAAVLPEAVTAAAGQSVVGSAVAKQPVVPFAGGDASVQGQITRSVGRAAVRAADLLANLPTLPKLRRRKEQ